MARGNSIVVTSNPRGVFMEGIIGAGLTPKPGTIMQIQIATALKGGRHTWELYAPGTSGAKPKGPLIVLREDPYQGKTVSDAYAAGDRAFGYSPIAGEELNLLLEDIAGTADDHLLGEIVIPKTATGKLIATTGTPSVTFLLKEAVTDPVADTLVWTQYGGY
jgi:hypothetical protein